MIKHPTFQNASFCEHLFEASLPNSGDSTGGLQIRSFFKSGPCGLKLHSNCSEEQLLPVLWAHHRRSVLERTHFFSFYLSALIEILNVPFLIDIWGSQTVFLMVLFIHFELKVLPTAKTSACILRRCTDNGATLRSRYCVVPSYTTRHPMLRTASLSPSQAAYPLWPKDRHRDISLDSCAPFHLLNGFEAGPNNPVYEAILHFLNYYQFSSGLSENELISM